MSKAVCAAVLLFAGSVSARAIDSADVADITAPVDVADGLELSEVTDSLEARQDQWYHFGRSDCHRSGAYMRLSSIEPLADWFCRSYVNYGNHDGQTYVHKRLGASGPFLRDTKGQRAELVMTIHPYRGITPEMCIQGFRELGQKCKGGNPYVLSTIQLVHEKQTLTSWLLAILAAAKVIS